MSDNMDELVRKAATITASVVFNSLKLKAAMIIVGFCADDAKAAKFQMRVRRYLQNNHQGSASIPSLIQCKSVNEVSTLVSQNIMLPSGVTQKPPPPAVSSIKRKISYMYDSDNDAKTSALSCVSTDTSSMSELAAIKQKLEDLEGTKLNPKRTRRTSAQKQNSDAMVVMLTDKEKIGMKVATTLVSAYRKLPSLERKKTSENAIINRVNKDFDYNLNRITVQRYVGKGLVGLSSLNRGPVGALTKPVYDALKGAFSTQFKIKQLTIKGKSTQNQLVFLVNACVKKGGYDNSNQRDLVRKLKYDTEIDFRVDNTCLVEQRSVLWTTYHNLNLWFDMWEWNVIHLGFRRAKTMDDKDTVGYIVFFPGQADHILNFDETAATLDTTTGSRGGRPHIVFYTHGIAGAATMASKPDNPPQLYVAPLLLVIHCHHISS